MSDKIKCQVCGEGCHVIEKHLAHEHPDITLKEYQRRWPKAPIYSKTAEALIAKHNKDSLKVKKENSPNTGYLHEVFELPFSDREAFSSVGNAPIIIQTCEKAGNYSDEYIPEVNKDYVFNTKELKNVLLAIDMKIPIYVWGHKGSGKTELFEQICARTNRPLLRIQHTANTEESQIVGQWVVRNGEMSFEYGPLPLAMINGWTYLADEYDFAMPNVLSVYQAVLEGKPLMIKEAPIDMRIVKPHENFRFVATGNTNGTGDETGLYQGTTIQNSANYDRFGLVVHKRYLDRESEVNILLKNTKINEEDARQLVEFAAQIREQFACGNISDTVSPRTLLFAARIGYSKGSIPAGIQLAFINKLSTIDRETISELIQRIYGERIND